MKLTFINHACLCIQSPGSKHALITDPWLISPAFGGWLPRPRPSLEDFSSFLKSLPEYSLVISHGHDDHCDDVLIRDHMTPKSIFIPKYRSSGFLRRVRKLVNDATAVVELEDGRPWSMYPYSLLSTVNPSYTANDAIIAIRDNEHTVIHANDNWHTQPAEVISQIREFTEGTDTTYLAQVGIAGSYPLYYRGRTWTQRSQESYLQLRTQLECIETNAKLTDSVRAYSYANESCFSYFDTVKHLSLDLRLEAISTRDCNSLYAGELANEYAATAGSIEFRNLRQEMNFLPGNTSAEVLRHRPVDKAPELVVYSHLAQLKEKINEYLVSRSIKATVDIKVLSYESLLDSLNSDESSPSSVLPSLTLCATKTTWLHILEGRWTLEALTIGGCGVIEKTPIDWHAGEVHDALSHFGYRYQASTSEAKERA